MRKLMHHYQKHLTSNAETDRIEWDMYRIAAGDTVTYELCGTLTYVADPSFCPTSENLAGVFEVHMHGHGMIDATITSYDKLTRILVIGTMLPYTDLDSANKCFSEIIQRLVSKP